jgi:hypothetical protein
MARCPKCRQEILVLDDGGLVTHSNDADQIENRRVCTHSGKRPKLVNGSYDLDEIDLGEDKPDAD